MKLTSPEFLLGIIVGWLIVPRLVGFVRGSFGR